jgi:polyisoprenoid-binding protein YceI
MKSLALFAAFMLTTAVSAATLAAQNPSDIRAGMYVVEPSHTRIQFTVDHMCFTQWFGDFTHASGSLNLDPAHVERSKVDISIPVASVSTTNAILDEELKSAQWFDAQKFPTIRFVSTRVVKTGSDKASITGYLTFHGVTRPVTLTTTFHGAGVNPLDKAYTAGFDATTSIKRSDFGVKTDLPPIGDTTTLRISAAFVKKPS